MTDEDVGMVLSCVAVMRNCGMEKALCIPYYEKLLNHHHITASEVNENALRVSLQGKLAKKEDALALMAKLFHDLELS